MPYLMSLGEKVGPVCNVDDHWKEEWGWRFDARRALSTGHKQDPKFAPIGGISSVNLEQLPALLPTPCWLCNDEVSELIEKFEPGRHVFLPYEIHREGNPTEKITYNLVNFCDPIPTIDIVHSDPKSLKRSNNIGLNGFEICTINTVSLTVTTSKLRLLKNSHNGRHVWVDAFTHTASNIFISDEFHSELIERYDADYLTLSKTY